MYWLRRLRKPWWTREHEQGFNWATKGRCSVCGKPAVLREAGRARLTLCSEHKDAYERGEIQPPIVVMATVRFGTPWWRKPWWRFTDLFHRDEPGSDQTSGE